MAFVKLDCGLLNSTLWLQREQRELFITALLMAEPHELRESAEQIEVRSLSYTGFSVQPGWYGFVPAAGIGIIGRAKVDKEIGLNALEALGSPDLESRSPEHDGRRMIRIDGGYLILNFQKYREKDHTSADRSRRYRERKLASHRDVDKSRVTSRSVTQAEAEAEAVNQTAPVAGLDPTAWDTWVSYRTEIKKPLRTVSILAAKKALAAYGDDQEAVVQQSIANGYQGLVPLKSGGNNGTRQQVDNSAIGQVRAANKRARDAQRRADAAGVGENDHDVRAPLEVKLRG